MRSALITLGLLIMASIVVPLPAAADHNTFVVASDAATNYGDAVTLKGQLLDREDFGCTPNPCPVSGRQVDFYVDGAFVGTDVTNSGGYAYLLLTAAPNWHAGTHEVRVQYDRRNTPTAPAVDLATLTISPEVTIVDAQTGYLRATVNDDDNTPLEGQSVRFTVTDPNGEVRNLCTAVSDADGNAQCTQALVGAGIAPLGLIQYEARFDGTGDYVADLDAAFLV